MPLSQAKILQPASSDLAPVSASELKQNIEEQTTAIEEEQTAKPEDKPDPKDQKEYSFTIDFKDRRGEVWKGKFENQILSIGQKRLVAIMVARMASNLPHEALDPLQIEVNNAIAHLEYSLTKKPDWAENFDQLLGSEPLFAAWEEVSSHEDTFHHLGEDSSAGTSSG